MPVASLLTSLQNFESAPTLVSYGGGAGATVNDDVIIEGIQSAGRRVDNATDKGFGSPFTATDLSAAGEHIKVWLFVTQWAAVTQVQVRISSGSADDHEFPAAEYPPLGGFVPVWVDVSRTPEVGGSANEAAINEVGVLLDIGDVGGNASNLILDEIAHGTSGLRWTGTSGTIADFRTFETTNASGVLVTTNGVDFCFARLEFGDGTTATTATVEGGSLIFPDQALVAATWMGLTVDASRTGDTFAVRNQTIASSDVVGATRRPDFVVTGTAAAVTIEPGALLLGMRLVELTSAVTVSGGTIDAVAVTPGGATISGCTIQTRSASSVACITAPTFTDISDVAFVQVGTGHALEISAAGTYGLVGLTFDGYGADGTTSSAIDVTATSGTVTINVTGGGDTPTYTSAGATVVINNAVTVSVDAVEADGGAAIQDARVYLTAAAGGPLTVGTVILSGLTDASGHIETTFAFASNQPVTGWVRKSTTAGTLYKEASLVGTITSAGYGATAPMTKDE